MEKAFNPRELFNELVEKEQQNVADFFSLHAVATRIYNNMSQEARDLIDYYVQNALCDPKVDDVRDTLIEHHQEDIVEVAKSISGDKIEETN